MHGSFSELFMSVLTTILSDKILVSALMKSSEKLLC